MFMSSNTMTWVFVAYYSLLIAHHSLLITFINCYSENFRRCQLRNVFICIERIGMCWWFWMTVNKSQKCLITFCSLFKWQHSRFSRNDVRVRICAVLLQKENRIYTHKDLSNLSLCVYKYISSCIGSYGKWILIFPSHIKILDQI